MESNILEDCARLRNKRKFEICLSRQPIFKHICYNCGRLLTDECKRNMSVALHCSSVILSHPPMLQNTIRYVNCFMSMKRMFGHRVVIAGTDPLTSTITVITLRENCMVPMHSKI